MASDEDLWDLKDRLEAANMWVSEVIDHGFIHSIYAFDPNHIPIEFSAPVPEVDIRKQPAMRDSRPCRVALEGAEPQKGKWPCPKKRTPAKERFLYPGEGTVLAKKSDEQDQVDY